MIIRIQVLQFLEDVNISLLDIGEPPANNAFNETITIHTQASSETITMPMICSLIEHSFLPVFSPEGKVKLYSKERILYNNRRKKMNFEI